eukprot:13456-Heterococcus_DN1.PRE.5
MQHCINIARVYISLKFNSLKSRTWKAFTAAFPSAPVGRASTHSTTCTYCCGSNVNNGAAVSALVCRSNHSCSTELYMRNTCTCA